MFFNRTFHPDEANQAFTTARLLETGRYAYRPDDHHGPTLYYAAAAIQKAAGHDTLATLDGTLLRCTPLLFAILALVFGFLSIRKLLKSATGSIRWLVPGLFALLLGSSPIFAFFATDFIQEMLLACFTLMMLWAGVGYIHAQAANGESQNAKLKPGSWSLFFGTAGALAFATKETCALSFAAAALAAAPFLFRRLSLDAVRTHARDIVLSVLGFLIIACLLYSDFGRDFHGVYNAFVAAPRAYLGRAAGSAASAGAADHVHPWWQYFQWLFRGQGAFTALSISGVLLGCMALLLGTLRKKLPCAHQTTFLYSVLYAGLLLAAYSSIPYKTPWCALQMQVPIVTTSLLGWFLFCAALASIASDRLPHLQARTVQLLAYLPLVLISTYAATCNVQTLARMNRDPDSKEIPYNYASASPDVRQLAAVVADAVEKAPRAEHGGVGTFIAVALPPADTWPFPWYNRPYESQTGYWTSFDDLRRLAETGVKPTVVIVPMAEGHLVQVLFPHLKHTKRFYMRPGVRNKEGKTRGGVRVRVFW